MYHRERHLNFSKTILDREVRNVYTGYIRRKGMGDCKDFMVIHLAPSSPLREVKEEGVFVFLKAKERGEK
ncbi:hypothetical protein DRJ19_05900 [Candidatus Woesearchaeota archaeon]|nr:MAG: hypothetical protein DRJ19_05900 [Candidatus Woesearchaeota archaeon]